jgi:bacterial/archaeal transporter family-2 protein
MKLPFYIFTIFLGIVLAVHLSMNGRVGSMLDNPRVANAFFWCVGAFMAVIIGITGWRPGSLNGLKDVHPALLTAGALGACLVFAIAWMIPRVGARGVFITLIAGQVFGGMTLSHFGWLGSPLQRVSALNIVGAVLNDWLRSSGNLLKISVRAWQADFFREAVVVPTPDD